MWSLNEISASCSTKKQQCCGLNTFERFVIISMYTDAHETHIRHTLASYVSQDTLLQTRDRENTLNTLVT